MRWFSSSFSFGFRTKQVLNAWSSVFGVCLLHVKKTLQLLVGIIASFDPVIVYLDNVE